MWVNEGCNEVSAEGNRGDNRDIFFPLFGSKRIADQSIQGCSLSDRPQLIDIELVACLWENDAEMETISAWLSSCIFLESGVTPAEP